MRRLALIGFVGSASLALSGCGGDGARVDLDQVLKRTVETLEKYDAYMNRYDYKMMSDPLYAQLAVWLNEAMNAQPRFYAKRIITRFDRSAAIHGYSDDNGNRKIDAGDAQLFKVELDLANNRLIAYAPGSSSGYGYRPRNAGFLTGYLVGSMLGRQRQVGIRHGHFNKMSVRASALQPASTARRGGTGGLRQASVRGRARSGGVRGGK